MSKNNKKRVIVEIYNDSECGNIFEMDFDIPSDTPANEMSSVVARKLRDKADFYGRDWSLLSWRDA